MTLEKAKKDMERFVSLKTSMRPAFVDVLLQAEEVRHGHWEYKPLWKGNEAKYCECSACHHPAWWATDYCSNCGAKMDEVET